MRKSKFVLAVLATTTAGIVTLAGSQAQARENAAPADVVAPAPAAPMFFAAVMRGATTDVPPADPDGRGVFVMRVQGNQVGFAMAWRNLAMPTASHVHLGAAGINGPVRIPFFGGLPANLTAVTGSVTVMDQALLDAIAADPAGFYANIHTTAAVTRTATRSPSSVPAVAGGSTSASRTRASPRRRPATSTRAPWASTVGSWCRSSPRRVGCRRRSTGSPAWSPESCPTRSR
ncbi:MAG: hypothetical protein AUI14_23065 [Actinobacteria bacterium 13_2_20CM_2_71_6]|nr:MAG: hypothetical protein AUI14_23065 [Actinobacteria bacterium 13_2_20CM_2_71_6]